MSLVKTDQLTNLSDNGPVEVLEGLTIRVGKNLSIKGPLLDKDGEPGSSTKVLTSTGDGVIWSNPSDLNTTYSISAEDSQTPNSKVIRLTSGGSGAGVTDDITLSGDSNITITRNDETISFSLNQNISTNSNVTFNSLSLTQDLTLFGELISGGNTGKILFDADSDKWQFTNDGTNFYNFLLPTETVYDVAKQFGASADPNGYLVSSTSFVVENSQTYLKVTLQNQSDISRFEPSQRIKIFNASVTDTNNLPGTVTGNIAVASFENELFINDDILKSWYVYAFAPYSILSGDIGTFTVYSTPIINVSVDEMNEANFNTLNINRNSSNEGVLVYRGIFTTEALSAAAITNLLDNGTNEPFDLIAVLGTKEFISGSLFTQYIDYGEYDLTTWTRKNVNGTYKADTVHFPLNPPLAKKRGWTTADIRDFNRSEGSFIIDVPGLRPGTDLPGGEAYDIEIYHDDTRALQDAIDSLSATDVNFLFLPGGTYLVDQLQIPDGFSLSGLDDATILKKQYWSTGNINSTTLDGVKNSLMIGKNFNANLDSSTWKISNFTLKDLVIDGNVENQILYDFSDIGIETNNTLISFPNSDFVTIQNVKIRNSPGPAVFAEGSTNLSISTSTFFDGCDTERYETDCLLLSDCENLTVTGSVFRNYPGALDFTTGKVIVVNGSVIRNCGSGIKIFGSVNTDVLNNVILGPADEFIPVADLYDSDYDGVNISVIRNADSQTPVYSYQQFGVPKDFTNTILKFDVYPASVANGLETINFNNPITSGGNPLFEYYVPVDNLGNPINDITIGEIQYRISSENSNLIPNKTVNSYTVYQISGIEYENIGSDIGTVIGAGILNNNPLIPNSYQITVLNENIYNSFIVGDYVKLLSHEYPNGFPTVDVWEIVSKDFTGLEPKLILKPYQQNTDGSLIPLSLVGAATSAGAGRGYFQRRNKFVIARGIISVA